MTKIRRKRLKPTTSTRKSRRQRQRIITIATSATCCLFAFYICGLILGRMLTTKNEDTQSTSNTKFGLDSLKLQKLDLQELTHAKDKLAQAASGAAGKLRNSVTTGTGTKSGGPLSMRRALTDPDSDPTETRRARSVLSARANLVDVEIRSPDKLHDDGYEGVIGHFCHLDFDAQKERPPELPMFRDVVGHSKCDKGKNVIRVDLKEAVELSREFDGDNGALNNLPNLLDLKGVVFHESRCGSTLAANSMMALNPKKHRVYSESSPPIAAIRGCGEDYSKCSVEASANLLKDIIYMMGRSDDPDEENLFFKFQSVTTRTMETFRAAFPTTPWIFLYREPIEVLMSQLDVPRKGQANCVRSKNSSPMIKAAVDASGYEFEDMIAEEFCAVHLATLCDSALRNLEDANGLGMAVNYHPDLVHDFLDTIFPKHFHAPVDAAGRERVLKISGTYSKNRGQHAEGDFKPDGAEKEKKASEEIKEAATEFLQPSFDKLQGLEYHIKRSLSSSGGANDEE